MQVIIDQRHELIERALIPFAPGSEQLRYLVNPVFRAAPSLVQSSVKATTACSEMEIARADCEGRSVIVTVLTYISRF